MTADRFARIGHTGDGWRVWYGENYGDGVANVGWVGLPTVARAFEIAGHFAGVGGRVCWHRLVAP